MKAHTYTLFLLTQLFGIFGSLLPLQDSPCVTRYLQSIIPDFAAGIPNLGTEQLDPVYIDSFNIDQDGYKTIWTNIYLRGLSNIVIDSSSIDFQSKVMRIVSHTDMSVKAHHVSEGYLLNLPFFGVGDVTMKFYNVHAEFVMPFDLIKDSYGRDIIDVKSYQYVFDVRDGTKINFGNLYNGNKEQSEKMHVLLHQNWKELTQKYARYLFNKVYDKSFNAFRTFMRSQPLATVPLC